MGSKSSMQPPGEVGDLYYAAMRAVVDAASISAEDQGEP